MEREQYLIKLDQITEEFRKEQAANCYKAAQYLKEKLNKDIYVFPGVQCGAGKDGEIVYNKLICIEIYDGNDVDYKTVRIGFPNVSDEMKYGVPFEISVYNQFINTLLNYPEFVESYEGNIFEKLLNTYVKETECFADGGFHGFNGDHVLLLDKEDGSEPYEVYMEDIEGLYIRKNEMVIHENIDGYEHNTIMINSDGITIQPIYNKGEEK